MVVRSKHLLLCQLCLYGRSYCDNKIRQQEGMLTTQLIGFLWHILAGFPEQTVSNNAETKWLTWQQNKTAEVF